MNNQEKMTQLSFEATEKNCLELYSIKDKKTNKFLPPFFALNTEDAKRTVANTVNYSNSLINKFPQDYELYYIGDFIDSTGNIVSVVNHDIVDSKCIVFICSLESLKSEDSIKYDELLKETKSLQLSVTSIIKEFDDVHAEYEKKLRELSILEDNIKAKTAKDNKNVEVFPVQKNKKLTLTKKKGILDNLFS